ncbi:NAD(+) synthase [Geofilum rubicundum]|uniref:NH(3)-dependent NAD(+) synthetase n=1 Tax=Geofilum rubicundum JCM 15548 TaxID=1236989 RepID=A0A0E9M3C8_9BACT|nr:NAD(+) synthase [Geofilum rubicundum]GAO31675.1 NAD synthetase [Geofilum rubicundum JCM 15548]
MISKTKPFSRQVLEFKNLAQECDQIIAHLKADVYHTLQRKGAVIGISGGIDSSLTLALTVKALGPENVLGILMPEQDSSPDSARLAHDLAQNFGIETVTENITGALKGFNCYKRRDDAVKRIFQEYNPATHKMKIGLNESGLASNLPQLFYLTIVDTAGQEQTRRLPANEFRQIVAASNFKQRSRMAILYYHAEANHYAAIGTPNKHEVQQGFFVKNGDGGADVMPIAHLYKTQVYQMAEHLGIPREIIERTPTSDTYTAEQTQEEFFFQMPFEEMDLYWYAFENGYNTEEVALVMNKTEEEVQGIFTGFERKIKTTDYLRMEPIKY